MFIKGLGTFDIQEAHGAFKSGNAVRTASDSLEESLGWLKARLIHSFQDESFKDRCVAHAIFWIVNAFSRPALWLKSDDVLTSHSLRLLLPSPGELRLYGYGKRWFPLIVNNGRASAQLLELLGMDVEGFRLKHLVRWQHCWNQPGRDLRLDELLMAPAREPDLPRGLSLDTRPRRLLEELRLLRLDIERGIEYEWLMSCPVYNAGEEGVLRPLRTSDDIIEVASRLHNCAADYAEDISSKECILVALVDKAGRYRALGQFDGHVWEQIVADHNRAPPGDVRAVFDRALPLYQEWWRSVAR